MSSWHENWEVCMYVNGNLKNIFRMKSDWELLGNFRKWGGRARSGACPGAVVCWALRSLISEQMYSLGFKFWPCGLSLSQQPSTDIDSLTVSQQNQKLLLTSRNSWLVIFWFLLLSCYTSHASHPSWDKISLESPYIHCGVCSVSLSDLASLNHAIKILAILLHALISQ